METRELVILNRNGKRMPATLRIPEGSVRGTALLVHGLAAWREQDVLVVMAGALVNAGYQVLTFDGADALRGPDASYWHSTTTGFIADVEDVMEFAQAEAWYQGPLLLAGHSLGAMCVVQYARRNPNVAVKLLLVAPAISWWLDRSDRVLSRVRWTATLVRLIKEKERRTGERFFNPLYPPWILDFFKYDTRKDARYISVPVLVVSAGDDLVVAGPQRQAALSARFPNATQVVIPGASHTFHEHEEELADTITTWLT